MKEGSGIRTMAPYIEKSPLNEGNIDTDKKLGNTKFRCHSCAETFSSETDLVKHLNFHNENNEQLINNPPIDMRNSEKKSKKELKIINSIIITPSSVPESVFTSPTYSKQGINQSVPQHHCHINRGFTSVIKNTTPETGLWKSSRKMIVTKESLEETSKHSILNFDPEPISYKLEFKQNVPTKFSCQFCGMEFKNVIHLDNHVMKLHEETIQNQYQKETHNNRNIGAVEGVVEQTKEIIAELEVEMKRKTAEDKETLSHAAISSHPALEFGKQQTQNESVKVTKKENEGKDKPDGDSMDADCSHIHLDETLNPDGKEHLCKLCKVNFKDMSEFNKHNETVHGMKKLRIRRKKSEIQDKYFCSVCNKGFTRNFDMKKHKKNQHGIVETEEDSTAAANKDYIESCKIVDSEGKTVFKCNICGSYFKKSSSLTRHRSIHTGDRPYCCEFCAKNFRTTSGLYRHINDSHHGIKKFECDICNKRFTAKASRDQHMNIHTNARPYVCDICGNSYKQKASLHIHKTYHAKNFRFSCTVCGRKYRRAQELKVHNWIHTGYKPYRCQICNAQFRLKQEVRRHKSIHHECVNAVSEVIDPLSNDSGTDSRIESTMILNR